MVAQGALPYQLEVESGTTTFTALAGLPIYLYLAKVVCLRDSIGRHLKIPSDSQGRTDAQMLAKLILLDLARGECVEDLEKRQGDEGFAVMLRRVGTFGLAHSMRRELERRWRESTERKVPSVSAMRLVWHRYLSRSRRRLVCRARPSTRLRAPVSRA